MNKFLLFSVFVVAFVTQILSAQIIDQTKPSYRDAHYREGISKAYKLIIELKDAQRIPGISVCIGWEDHVIWAEGFGEEDVENHVPVTIQTKFRIGSISKSLTGIGLMKLVQEGKISLDSPVTTYVKYFPGKKYPITIRQLASHTAGIRHYNYQRMEMFSTKHYVTVKESLNQFKSDTLLFEPGTKYGYSTFGYVLLSAAMEERAGDDFISFMQKEVFLPIGMNNTLPDFADSIINHRSYWYEVRKETIVKAPYVDLSGKWAGGGFLSTPLDLVLMSQKLFRNEFLNEKSLQALWTSNSLKNGETTGYCIGWRKGNDSKARSIIHHGGQSIGGRSFLIIYPESELVIALSCNISASFAEEFAEKIADCFLEGK